MGRNYRRNFEVDNISYCVEVTCWYEVLFYITGGRTPSGRYLVPAADWYWNFEWEFSPTKVVEETKRPFRVIGKLVECLFEYVSIHKPPYIVINNLGEPQRGRIYQKLAKRFAGTIPGYYVSWSEQGYILICKLEEARAGEERQ